MFYDRFETLCLQKGVRITRACQDMGLSRSLASKWKNTGTEKPSADVLERMSVYFGISINAILNPEEEENIIEEQKETPAPEIVDLGDEQLKKALLGMAELTPERQAIVFALIEELQSAQGK